MERFRTTRWSLVMEARDGSPAAARALDDLCRIYRPPVLAYVRRHAGNDAEDLAQAFFEQLLRLRTHATADPQRGRFRVYLLVALKRFLIRQAAQARTLRRGGSAPLHSLEQEQERGHEPPDPDTPEAAFERAWAETVLRRALQRLQDEAEAAGKQALFNSLRGFLLETPESAELRCAAERHGLRRNTLAVALHRLRQRLRELVREELADTVDAASELEAELAALHAALARPEAVTRES